MTTTPLRLFLLACLALGSASVAQAAIIVIPTFDPSNQAAPPDTTDYEGNFFDGTSAPYDLTIGAFGFTIPKGYRVTAATISGTFGDVNFSTTALADLFVDGIDVAGCDSFSAACAAGTVNGSLVSWSYTFTGPQIAADFAGGSLNFTAVQNSFGAVIVGTPTLTIQDVPEPSSIFTVAGGLLAFVVWPRRK